MSFRNFPLKCCPIADVISVLTKQSSDYNWFHLTWAHALHIMNMIYIHSCSARGLVCSCHGNFKLAFASRWRQVLVWYFHNLQHKRRISRNIAECMISASPMSQAGRYQRPWPTVLTLCPIHGDQLDGNAKHYCTLLSLLPRCFSPHRAVSWCRKRGGTVKCKMWFHSFRDTILLWICSANICVCVQTHAIRVHWQVPKLERIEIAMQFRTKLLHLHCK